MKLVNPDWNRQIEFTENTVSILVMENKQMFREILIDLKNQTAGTSGKLLLEDSVEVLKLSKSAEVILDYVTINLNDKKILSKLYNNLRAKALEEYEGYSEIVDKVSDYVENLIFDEETDLVQIKNVDPIDIFKSVGLELEQQELTEQEKLLEYTSLLQRICEIKVFFFVNLKAYFSERELKELYETLLNRKVKFLLIESSKSEISDDRERFYIFDDDCCEI